MIEFNPPYTTLTEALIEIDEPNQSRCMKLYEDSYELISKACGSRSNHQAWPGGYYDHVLETMNCASVDYQTYTKVCNRSLPFSLSDALLVLFLHDLEKPWKYATLEVEYQAGLNTKAEREAFRLNLIQVYEIDLTPDQQNALKYAEGIRDADYSPTSRVMNELATFVHRCDLWSARLFHNHP